VEFETLRGVVWQANVGLASAGLVTLTWGNASGVDRGAGVVAIKPSGVDYEHLEREHIVVLSLETGEVLDGDLAPSSDSPTHLALYRSFERVGGVVHTHSTCATAWAQARREIPPLGTTHADHFHGPVPLTRQLTAEEIEEVYEHHTGEVIVGRFIQGDLDCLDVPGVLVPCHGPFTWGRDPLEAMRNAIALEEIARMALYTLALCPDADEMPEVLLRKHFLRKHGPDAYYGQPDAG
jgi:L-ribulose-5-phosphate 4-epimerase